MWIAAVVHRYGIACADISRALVSIECRFLIDHKSQIREIYRLRNLYRSIIKYNVDLLLRISRHFQQRHRLRLESRTGISKSARADSFNRNPRNMVNSKFIKIENAPIPPNGR